jgi:GntR family transcriptional repressor for pyruvate dehydrogenase complex
MHNQVQRRQVYEAVMERIRDDIASGRLKAGDRLESLRELAQRLGVGQSSVREAVRVLSYMGLLRVKHGEGIFVTERLSRDGTSDPMATMPEGERASLRHLMELRLVIEPLAARWAAERATPEERAEITRRCEEVQAILRRNIEFQERRDFQEEDVEFHMAIVRAAHNPLLLDALERVRGQLRLGRQITSHVPQLVDSALRFHPQIAHSIRAGEAARVESFARAHVEDVIWWLEAHDAQRLAHVPNTLPAGDDSPRPPRQTGGLLTTTLEPDSPSIEALEHG